MVRNKFPGLLINFMPPKIIRVPANAELDQIIDQLSDDQSSEFTDEEMSPHEMEVTVVVELALKWLIDGDGKRATAPTKKQFLEVISTFCSLDRYMSPKDVLDILEVLGVAKEDNRELTFNQALITNIQINKEKHLEPVVVKYVLEDMSRRKELSHCYASGVPASKTLQIPLLNDPIAMKALRYTIADNIDDLKIVVERTLFWMQGNSSVPTNIHEFLHSLTPYCGVKHTVSEKEAFEVMVQKGYVLQLPKMIKSKERIEFVDERIDQDENTVITLAPKGKAILDLQKKDIRNKTLASCSFLLLFLVVFIIVPTYIL